MNISSTLLQHKPSGTAAAIWVSAVSSMWVALQPGPALGCGSGGEICPLRMSSTPESSDNAILSNCPLTVLGLVFLVFRQLQLMRLHDKKSEFQIDRILRSNYSAQFSGDGKQTHLAHILAQA